MRVAVLSVACLALASAAFAQSSEERAAARAVVAKRSDAVIVVIFPDGGEKYLSERFWGEG